MRALLALGLAMLAAGCSGGEAAENATPEEDAPSTTQEATPTAADEPATTEPEKEKKEKKTRLRLARVATGLESPVHLTATASEPDRLYVVEQAGRIRILEGGELRPKPFLDVVELVRSGGEQGLLSLAFHPDYAENRLLYVDYTNVDGDTRVVEYGARPDGSTVDEETRRELLAVDQPYSNHNGGQLAFGPDGLLYVGMGDGGSGGDPENNAQNLESPLGKLLRLDVSDRDPEPEIAAYGLRNPWRFSFDRRTDGLYIGDVGQSAFEEIDYLPRDRLGSLANFGWDVFEGESGYEDKQPSPEGRLVGPTATYGRDDGCSVTGGFVYRGERVPVARGRYFYGDYCTGNVWSLVVEDGKARVRRERFEVQGLSSFGEDARGELYLVSLGGTIFRLAAE